MTNTIRLVNEDGTTTELWLRKDPPNAADAILCQSHELPMAAARVVDRPNPGRSGRTDLTGRYDATVFKAQLRVQDDATATRHQYVDRLRGLAAPHRRPYLYIRRDGWTGERRAVLRGDPLSTVVDQGAWQRLGVSCQWTIPDGHLEDTVVQQVTIPTAAANVGRSYPRSWPWAYTAAALASAPVTSAGTVPTPPILRMYGRCTDPVMRSLTTGQQLALTGLTLASNTYLMIDVANRMVCLNGDPSLNYYQYLNFTTSDWWEIQPGPNVIAASAATADSACVLVVQWRDRWI